MKAVKGRHEALAWELVHVLELELELVLVLVELASLVRGVLEPASPRDALASHPARRR